MSEAASFKGVEVYENVNPRILELYAGEGVVLDVGCGSGALGAALKRVNPAAEVHGWDLSPQAGERARQRLDAFHCVDLDAGPLPELSRPYQLVILGDVLEHLKRPDLLLVSLKRYLAPGGKLIVSVPNIANFGIRWRLLLGRFDYTETGIMDRTHLRFFTCRTIDELAERAGYRVVGRGYISRFPAALAALLPGLLTVQIVLKLEVVE